MELKRREWQTKTKGERGKNDKITGKDKKITGKGKTRTKTERDKNEQKETRQEREVPKLGLCIFGILKTHSKWLRIN